MKTVITIVRIVGLAAGIIMTSIFHLIFLQVGLNEILYFVRQEDKSHPAEIRKSRRS